MIIASSAQRAPPYARLCIARELKTGKGRWDEMGGVIALTQPLSSPDPDDGTRGTMTTARRAEANAQNALKSTGPRTPEGKSVSRLNALKHGLLSRKTLLPGENKDVLASLSEGLRAALRPEGELEDLLVDRITSVVWRLRRLGRIEVGVLSCYLGGILVERAQQNVRTYERDPMYDPFDEPKVTDKEKHEAAVAGVQEAMARQEEATETLGLAFIRDSQGSDAFSKLARYDAMLERSLFRALHELERLQAARAGHPVTPPLAVDIDVSQDR